MLEMGHFLADQEAILKAQDAIKEGRVEDAVIATKQQIAVARIRAFTASVLEELNIPDIRSGNLIPPPEFDEKIAEQVRNMPLGGAISYFRTQLGMSFTAVAGEGHLNARHISRIEHGQPRSIGLNTVRGIIRGFGWTEQDWRAQLLLERQRETIRTRTPRTQS